METIKRQKLKLNNFATVKYIMFNFKKKKSATMSWLEELIWVKIVKKASQNKATDQGERVDGTGHTGTEDGHGQAADAFIILKACAGELGKTRLEKEVLPESQWL